MAEKQNTIPAAELSEIKAIIEQAVNGLAFKRSHQVILGNYTANARIVGVDWRGEVLISIEKRRFP